MFQDANTFLIALAIAVVLGVILGHLVASRTARRPWMLYAGVWLACLLPRVAVILLHRGAGAGVAMAAGEPALIILVAEGLRFRRTTLNAARSLGASEWRIFWQVFLPEGFLWIGAGILLAWGRWLVDLAIFPLL
jgi:ABC-type spermidine/putrescine transport system permease subunit II